MDARTHGQSFTKNTLARFALALFIALTALITSANAANDAQWIWSPAQEGAIPTGSCYFRKMFEMNKAESGEVQITADNSYELYVNGRLVGSGEKWTQLDTYDITKYLVNGLNCVAIKATNTESPDAGLVGQVIVKGEGGTHVSLPTDKTWRTSLKESPHWNKTTFDQKQWLLAREIGVFGKVKPWMDEVTLAGGGMASRFRTQKDFAVEQVMSNEQIGSVICIAFNEFGEILASREGGPLQLLRDSNRDGMPDQSTIYCDQVTSCQGILPLNGAVFVIGAGPSGPGMYKLSDMDGDNKAEKVDLLLKFTGEMGEHGPHALTLGPDGLIYIMHGNSTAPERVTDPSSPYRNYYEGDLLPKYNDPRGQAFGIKAPGGRILRTDTEASFLETYAGGLRNAYDLAFNKCGDLLTYDSDMEWDIGTPWYRPTRVLHILSGGEYGWRSGWSKFQDYQYDNIPPIAETGRGSPSGMTFYNHVMYPRRYHDAVFLGDWSRGRIVCLKFKPNNGSYKMEGETFVEGRPLNVTDLAVGPDGWLYFCTGGRATDGGIYRVVWKGTVPPAVTDLGTGIDVALRQPQLDSAYARQKCAVVRQQMGKKWDEELTKIVENPASKLEYRVRGLELMQLLGPFPTAQLLTKLTTDNNEELRAKATYMMGIHSDASLTDRLLKLARDSDPTVQRIACEALVRSGVKPEAEDVLPLLKSESPFVSWAATRLLETLPVEKWKDLVLKSDSPRIALNGGLALVRVSADKATCTAILEKNQSLLQGFLSDNDFLAMLRLSSLALQRGGITSDDMPALRTKLADEYPTKDHRLNRELVRLMTYLKEPRATDLFLEQLRGPLANEEKLHIAFHARFLENWTSPQKLELLSYYETARTVPGGHSYLGYIENVSRDFFAGLTEQEREFVLNEGSKWPSSALSVLAKLPAEPDAKTLEQLIKLDREVVTLEGEAPRKLGIGIIAVLGRCGNETSMKYLREAYERDPQRRGYIAMALAQHPNQENWPTLVQSLNVVEGVFAQEVLAKLATVDRSSVKPADIRIVILRGMKLGENGSRPAISLLEKWTHQKFGMSRDSATSILAQWQSWYAKTYPNEPEATLPVDDEQSKWTAAELLSYLETPEAKKADANNGKSVFAKAQCAACHRHGETGEGIGPELSSVSRRFQNKEILESILYPSLVISDQYSSKEIETKNGRVISGMVADQPDGSVIVLMSNGEKVTLEKSEIEKSSPSKTSAMPKGLLNSLTLEEIGELFAFMQQQPKSNLTSRRPPTATK